MCRLGKVGPIGWDQGFAAIRQNQDEMQSTLTLPRQKNVERLAFERMASTDYGDFFRKVLMMGSVSWFRLIESITIA